jgi:hypothetical protein
LAGVAGSVAIAVIAGIAMVAIAPTRTDAATTVPSAPRTVKATNGNARVTLSWLKPLYDRGFPITSYIVSGRIPATGATIPTVTTTTLSASVTGLKNGTTYSFTVAARNSQGIGPSSAGVGIKVGQPGQVSAVTATVDFTSARLTWPAPASNGAAITQYQVKLFQNGVADGSQIFKSAATTQTVTGLAGGGTYTFTVAAKNTYGYAPVSPKSNAITAVQSPNAKPPPGGYFTTLAAGAALPSEATCASQVRRSSWEPRTANDAENHAVPPQPPTVRNHPDFNSTWQSVYKPRITGNFTGTTDEIIQWASCKWGIADDVIRAQAVQESNWNMHTEGDDEPQSAGVCTHGDTRNPCPTSFGMLQIKWYYNPDENPVNNSYPQSKLMTAFSLDYSLAQFRGCYEGWEFFGTKSRGDLWGCLGAWWSGGWRDSGALAYIDRVKNYYNTKPWLGWSG